MKADAVAWHDVECASYAADVPLWQELAAERSGPVLEVGCGTGRVSLELAAGGYEVTALDADAELVRELAARARRRGLSVDCAVADVRSFSLGRSFPLAIAPMQVMQLLGGPPGRRAALSCLRRHLLPGGLLAVSLADPFEAVPAEDALPPLPDLRESDGWVLSSTPLSVRSEPGSVAVDRLRQAVSPSGELREEMVTVRLDELSADLLEAEATGVGFVSLPPRRVPETPDHLGSTVVLLEAPR